MNLQNISNTGRYINLFIRTDKGLEIRQDKSFYPYYFEKDNNGKFIGYDGTHLRKVIMQDPRDVFKSASRFAWSSDINYCKRYIIDKVDSVEAVPFHYAMFDIEVKCQKLPHVGLANEMIPCISLYSSFDDKIISWFVLDFNNELDMLQNFIEFIKNQQFDLFIAWNIKNFDYPYLYNRCFNYYNIDFAKSISPIGEKRYTGRDESGNPVYYPSGLSVVDYKGLYEKFTLNKRASYALDFIAREDLGEQSWGDTDFNEISKEVLDKNINDVNRMLKLEKKFKVLDYFSEIRSLTKCLWEDLPQDVLKRDNRLIKISNNIKPLEFLFYEEAKTQNLILPNKPLEKNNESFQGAFRETYSEGVKNNINLWDLTSAYPSMILDFCLDSTNLTEEQKESCKIDIIERIKDGKGNVTFVKSNTLFYKQDNTKLLPKVTKKLLTLKDNLKIKLDTLKVDSKEYKVAETAYKAVKSQANCFTPDTDIITKDGICNIKDVKIGQKVYNVNIHTMEIEEDEIIDTQEFDYDDVMYHYKSDRADLCLTKDHRMILGQVNKIGFQTIEYIYKNLRGHWCIPKVKPLLTGSTDDVFSLFSVLKEYGGNIYIKPKEKMLNILRKHSARPYFSGYKKYNCNQITEEEARYLYENNWEVLGQISLAYRKTPIFYKKQDFCKLLGWFLSEGNLYKSKRKKYETATRGITYRVDISQSKKVNFVNYNIIIKLLNDMGLKPVACKKNIYTCSELLYHYLRKSCYVNNQNIKKIPEFLFSESFKNRKIFYDSYYLGDGDKTSVRLSCTPKKLFMDLFLMLVINGNNNLRWQKDKDRCHRLFYGNNKKFFREKISKKRYKGKVYCVTTKKNHTIFAGRNGTFVPTGQSVFGSIGNPHFRLSNPRVVSTIAFLVRDLLVYVEKQLSKKGYKIVFIDTDSVAVETRDNITELLNELIQEWGLKYNKKNVSIKFNYEGYFDKVMVLSDCHYYGYLIKPDGQRKKIIKGVEIIRSSSAKFESEFQENLIEKVLEGATEKDILKWIEEEQERIKTFPLDEVAFPFKIKSFYKNVPIYKRAYENTRIMDKNFDMGEGEIGYYIFIKPEKLGYDSKPMDVIALTDDINKYTLNWDEIIRRNIYNKAEKVFNVMKWSTEKLKNPNQLFLL